MPFHRILPATLALALLLGAPGASQDLRDEARKGTQLTAAEAAALEERLAANPQDLAVRARLLGYLFRQRTRGSSGAHSEHVLWFIRNLPASEVHKGAWTHIVPMFDPDGYVEAKEAWLGLIEAEPKNAVFLEHAAGLLGLTEAEAAAGLLERAETLEPTNPHWAERLGELRWRKAHNPFQGPDVAGAARALADFERAHALSDAAGRAELLTDLAVTSFVAGDFEKARRHATVMLEAPSDQGHRGLYVHYGNLVLGRIALAEGDLEEAGARLLAAGRTPGAPTLRSFGPDMALAAKLLESGETQTVLRYLNLCLDFWERGQDELQEWIILIEAGRTPDFRRNLRF